MIKKIRGEVTREKWMELTKKIILDDWGQECEPHDEECVICNVYKALNEFKRHYEKKD